jgi:hypothetical protein
MSDDLRLDRLEERMCLIEEESSSLDERLGKVEKLLATIVKQLGSCKELQKHLEHEKPRQYRSAEEVREQWPELPHNRAERCINCDIGPCSLQFARICPNNQ